MTAPGDAPSLLSQLRWSDIVAVVGALAWLPYLIKLFRRPSVTAIVGYQIEIGFTGLGPIFNPSIALRAINRDALVTDMRVVVVHERRQQTTFRAQVLAEVGASSQSTGGESVVHQRQQSAAALVLMPGQITERKVMCMSLDHRSQMDPLVVAYQRAIRRTQNANADAWFRAVQASPEYHALREFFLGSFVWQAGEYTATFSCAVENSSDRASVACAFTLTDQQIIVLRDNNVGLDWELKRIWSEFALQPPGVFRWQWVYVDVR